MDFGYVTNVVISTRRSNVEDVEKFHALLKEKFDLKKFEYTHKEIKEKGEVVEEYELVKATLVFNIEKTPDAHINIDFNYDTGNFPITFDTEDDENAEF